MNRGVVVLEGEKPVDGTLVDITPAAEASVPAGSTATHPALGIWKGRTDLPEDWVEASNDLRERLMRRANG
ncbi:hypothetical protein BH10PLA1_BH10PLA1_10640 [soil metagenome]